MQKLCQRASHQPQGQKTAPQSKTGSQINYSQQKSVIQPVQQRINQYPEKGIEQGIPLPLLNFFVLKWALKETFHLAIPMPPIVRRKKDDTCEELIVEGE